MAKSLSAYTSIILLVCLLAVVANASTSRAKFELFRPRAHVTGNSSNTTNTTQYLPPAYITGMNLSTWYNTPWWTFSNYTLFNYTVRTWNASFTGTTKNGSVNGIIKVTFDAYGNNSYVPYWNMSQIWEYNISAILDVYYSNVYSINFDRQLAIYPSDLRTFLRAWVEFSVVPSLLKNSSNTTGIQFPEYNITGYQLGAWINQYNAYPNYTSAGYYVYVYNFGPYFQKYGNNVYGAVNVSFVAFGNDTTCWGYYCNQTTVYSNATIYVNGVQPNDTLPDIYGDYGLRVNFSDVQNFLRGYFYAVMVPNITTYYNITTNTTTNRTIYLPNYYNESQVNIDCSRLSWYCSGANPDSYLSFFSPVGYNLSITVNDRGNGYFNGRLNLPYVANLINSTSTYYGKETINSNVQGNATLYLWGQVNGTGNNTYHVTLDSYASANVIFDRNYFVQNAAQHVYSDRFRWEIQWFVNNILSNGTRYQQPLYE